jgi:tetratricopeptide (TPR) repeat protein/predicted Ser/Thr protein kinase
MTLETAWYKDETSLIAELREEIRGSAPPTLVGYSDLRELRRGGQGVVYTGTQESTKRRVAIKVLLQGPATGHGQPKAHERFQQEIDLVASFQHPGIVRLYDSGLTDDGRPYLVMELIEGVPLNEYLAQSSPNTRHTVTIFQAITDAVSYAHQRGVIHRDLKPANVRMTRDGRPLVLDFGLAKLIDTPNASVMQSLSMSGQFLGSLPWSSPEQASGDTHTADVRSDVYAIGVMMYHALTGYFPYEVRGSIHTVLENILHTEPQRLRLVNREIDEELAVIVHRCLAKEPERRYQSAGELAADLSRYLAGEPILARADSSWYVLRKQLRRYRLALSASAIVAGVAVAATAASTYFWSDAVAQREAAVASRYETDAVNTFLHSMLASIDPALARGHEVTVREILDQASHELGAETHPPLVKASLHQTIGWTYFTLGQRDDAEHHLGLAYELRATHLGEEHVDTLQSALSWGKVLMEQEHFDDADRVLSDAAARVHRTLGEDHDFALQAEGYRGFLWHFLGELEQSRMSYQRVLDGYARRGEPEHEEAIATMNNLAALLSDMAEYDDAGALYERVLAQRERVHGPDAPRTIISRANLAMHHNYLGDYELAEQLMQRVIEDSDRVLGEWHPASLNHRMSLAMILADSDRYEQAAQIYDVYLPLMEQVLGADSTDTLRVSANYGYVLMQLEQYHEARDIMQQTVNTMADKLGSEHYQTLSVRHNLAGVLEKLDQPAEARDQLMQVYDARVQQLGAAHLDTLLTLNNIAWLHLNDDDAVTAERMFADVIHGLRQSLGDELWIVHLVRGSRGRALIDLGRHDEARSELLDVHERFVEHFGPDHARTSRVQEFLEMLDQ